MTIASTVESATGTTSVIVSAPAAGWYSGSLLIATVSSYGTNTIPATLLGWTQITSATSGSGATAISMSVQYLVLSAAGPASYTFVTLGSTEAAVVICEYSQVYAGGTIDVTATNTGTTSTTLTGSSVTTRNPNEIVLVCAALGSGSVTASNWTTGYKQEAYQLGGSGESSIYVAAGFQPLAEATGSITATLSNSAVNWVTATIALVPYSGDNLTVVTLSSTNLDLSWTVPANFSNQNVIQVIAGGGGGGNTYYGTSGGGGQFSSSSNLLLSGSIPYEIGIGGTGGAGTVGVDGEGTAGGNSWFNGTSISAASVSAGGGQPSGGSGGNNGIGSITYAGGNGAVGANAVAASGGGAGGPFGIGGTGSPPAGTNGYGGTGGGGGGGGQPGIYANSSIGAPGGISVLDAAGGIGGTSGSQNGGTGSAGAGGGGTYNPQTNTEFPNGGAGGNGVDCFGGAVGSGGGGGGGFYYEPGTVSGGGEGGAGGLYGGGGAGASGSLSYYGVGGAGAQGIIVIAYINSGTQYNQSISASNTETVAFTSKHIIRSNIDYISDIQSIKFFTNLTKHINLISSDTTLAVKSVKYPISLYVASFVRALKTFPWLIFSISDIQATHVLSGQTNIINISNIENTKIVSSKYLNQEFLVTEAQAITVIIPSTVSHLLSSIASSSTVQKMIGHIAPYFIITNQEFSNILKNILDVIPVVTHTTSVSSSQTKTHIEKYQISSTESIQIIKSSKHNRTFNISSQEFVKGNANSVVHRLVVIAVSNAQKILRIYNVTKRDVFSISVTQRQAIKFSNVITNKLIKIISNSTAAIFKRWPKNITEIVNTQNIKETSNFHHNTTAFNIFNSNKAIIIKSAQKILTVSQYNSTLARKIAHKLISIFNTEIINKSIHIIRSSINLTINTQSIHVIKLINKIFSYYESFSFNQKINIVKNVSKIIKITDTELSTAQAPKFRREIFTVSDAQSISTTKDHTVPLLLAISINGINQSISLATTFITFTFNKLGWIYTTVFNAIVKGRD
jgi:hypothetical protein